ncbi:MAG: hypothetical protein QOE92_130, partial [Chloroflexota bacterium]|nr:hypothetical protein [Chloroflexota bacterium]
MAALGYHFVKRPFLRMSWDAGAAARSARPPTGALTPRGGASGSV